MFLTLLECSNSNKLFYSYFMEVLDYLPVCFYQFGKELFNIKRACIFYKCILIVVYTIHMILIDMLAIFLSCTMRDLHILQFPP